MGGEIMKIERERRDESPADRRDLQGSSSRDDLNELLGDDGLSGAVEGEGQLVNHLSWVGVGGLGVGHKPASQCQMYAKKKNSERTTKTFQN